MVVQSNHLLLPFDHEFDLTISGDLDIAIRDAVGLNQKMKDDKLEVDWFKDGFRNYLAGNSSYSALTGETVLIGCQPQPYTTLNRKNLERGLGISSETHPEFYNFHLAPARTVTLKTSR
jgi:hypothetical protein